MQIDYEGQLPPHRQIAGWIRERIRGGEFDPQRRIPSETDIMGETGVARTTARRAVALLREEGWVHTIPGRGSFAVPPGERPQ